MIPIFGLSNLDLMNSFSNEALILEVEISQRNKEQETAIAAIHSVGLAEGFNPRMKSTVAVDTVNIRKASVELRRLVL
jgi:hypothetical protein